MAMTLQMSNDVTKIQQILAQYDDAGQDLLGKWGIASRLFEMNADYTAPIADVVDDNGVPLAGFHCKFTDDDLLQHFPMRQSGVDESGKPIMVRTMTAEEFARGFFGAMNIASMVPVELADLIGRLRA